MKIEYFGHACFCIETENGLKILTDPYTKVGYELPTGITADVVLVSHSHFDHNYLPAVNGEPFVLDCEKEVLLNGARIVGKPTWHDPAQGALRGSNLIFKIQTEGVMIAHFGDLGESYSQEVAEKLAGADVWMIPVGGTYTIDAKQAKEYIEKLSPKLVIPMHFRPEDGKLDIAPIDVFLQEMNAYPMETCTSGQAYITKEILPNYGTKILYMERRK